MGTFLDERLRQSLNRELQPGEQLAWYGQPSPGRMAWRSLPAVLFAIPWTGFAIFWMLAAGGFVWFAHAKTQPATAPSFSPLNFFGCFPLFGLPFVLIGLGMFSSPLWMLRKARRTLYAVTDRRVILFEGSWSTTVTSLVPDQLKDLTRKERLDGSGDLFFGQPFQYFSRNQSRPMQRGFIGIPNVREVEELVRRIKTPASDQ